MTAALKSRGRTPAQRAASRSNSRKSTGPKTPGGKRVVALNALKKGTRALWQGMAELGEDPRRYQSLLRDVVRSYPPHNPLELRLCEDITRLMLKSERVQMAQEAKLVRAGERLDLTRQKQRREMQTSYDAPQAQVLETGLRRAPDSPAKFTEITACLKRLRGRVEGRDFSDETELEALYGRNPTFRGAGMINSFRALAENQGNPEERDLLASLRLMILEETRDVAEEYQLYCREHIEVSRALRVECLAPVGDPEYVLLERQEEVINRQLERKIKLLLSVRAAARRAAKEAVDESTVMLADLAPDLGPELGPESGDAPLGWRDTATGGGAVEGGEKPTAAGADLSFQASEDRASLEPSRSTRRARAVALRHKIGTPRISAASNAEKTKEMMRQIYEVYGVTYPPESSESSGQAVHDNGPTTASTGSTNGRQKAEGGRQNETEPGASEPPRKD